MAAVCNLFAVLVVLYIDNINGSRPSDGNVTVWNYLQSKLSNPDGQSLGEQDEYLTIMRVDQEIVWIRWNRVPIYHKLSLSQWGIEIRDTINDDMV